MKQPETILHFIKLYNYYEYLPLLYLYIFFIEINVENINITYTGVEGVPGFSLREDVKINYIFEPDHLKLEWPVCLQ